MGAQFFISESPWFTNVNGTKLKDASENPVVQARIDALSVEQLAAMVMDAHTLALEEFVDDDFTGPDDDGDDDAIDAAYRAAGADRARRELRAAVTALEKAGQSFDGHRWIVRAGGTSWGDSPSDAFDQVNLLAASGIASDPVDGPCFDNVPALSATIALVDTVTDRVLAAVAVAAERPGATVQTVHQAAQEAAAHARGDVSALTTQWLLLEGELRLQHSRQIWAHALGSSS